MRVEHQHLRCSAHPIDRQSRARQDSDHGDRESKTQLNYAPTTANQEVILGYIPKHRLPLTAESLMQAFNALKPTLAQSDKGVSYGSTTVVDFGERRENPSFITAELKDTIRRKITKMSSAQYDQWCLEHPNEVTILDED